jgi:hypothetical protein
MDINNFGSVKNSKEDEIRAIKEFWGQLSGSENAEKLYDYLISEIDSALYDKTCDPSVSQGKIKLRQLATKEYFHSGSEQPEKIITIECITAEEFDGYEKVPLNYFYQSINWANFCSNFVQVKRKGVFEEPVLVAFDFLGLPLVKLSREIYSE